MKDLLHAATRPRVEMPCAKAEPRMDHETAVHTFYRHYKVTLDTMLEHSDKVKSFIPFQGRLSHFLTKMNYALHSYDSTLNCDWQAITAKYIQLSFQVRNLNFWRESVQEN